MVGGGTKGRAVHHLDRPSQQPMIHILKKKSGEELLFPGNVFFLNLDHPKHYWTVEIAQCCAPSAQHAPRVGGGGRVVCSFSAHRKELSIHIVLQRRMAQEDGQKFELH